MRSRFLVPLVALLLGIIPMQGQGRYDLSSPDGMLAVSVTLSDSVRYTVSCGGRSVLGESVLALHTDQGVFGPGMRVKKVQRKTVDDVFATPVNKRSRERDHYNELAFVGRGCYDIVFRAYDEGIAYRFVYKGKAPLVVESETARFRLGRERNAYVPYVRKTGDFSVQFFNTFENTYEYAPLGDWQQGRLAFLPILAEADGGLKVCITESDLEHYPGMYLYNPDGGDVLEGVFAPYPAAERQGSHDPTVTKGGHNMVVTAREPWIARIPAGGVMPWRVLAVSREDKDLLDNNLVYKLARPSEIEDCSWIKPGLVAWEWFSDRNLFGVDFETGVNNETYRYYIDFAAANGIPYVVLDDGWYDAQEGSAFAVVPEIDLPMLIAYGREKGVDLMLWMGYYVFQKDMEDLISHYAAMGIKGFKLDAIGRDDQKLNEFYYRSAALAARHHVVVDFHGGAKPAGINRTWPNVLNVEGVHGLEQLKAPSYVCDQVTYDVTFPFIRSVAGPVDYTQGAMRNATRESFRQVWSDPMSQGTRCRQLAEYVVFESPLNMLCDTPSHYMQEPECTAFLTGIPTVWASTLPIEGAVGEYVTIAREDKDGNWWLGGLTSWNPRDAEIDLSFLPGNTEYRAEIFEDGVNAHRNAADYRLRQEPVNAESRLHLHLAPGGGFAIKLEKL